MTRFITQEDLNIELQRIYDGELGTPPHSKVLVRLEKIEEEVSKGGIVIVDNRTDELKAQAMCRGTILAIGPFAGYRRGIEFRGLTYKVGDNIEFYRYAGTLKKESFNGYYYRMLEDLDIDDVKTNKLLNR